MALLASFLGPSPETSSEGALAPALGLFVGSQAPADVLALGRQLDVSPTIDTVYAGGSDYNSYTPPSGIPAGMTLMLGVGALTPAQATSIGDNLVAAGQSHAIIRVMWEQNQDVNGWFQGWNQLTFPTAASYIAEFQSVVTTMRAVPGQAFSFMWNPNGGTGSEAGGRTWQDTWPGASFVNIVGVDQYDYAGYAANIQAVVSFAQSQGLPVAIPEWGLNGTDDPAYINGVAGIVNNPANDVVVQAYFSFPGSIDSDITQFPQSQAAYAADFQGSDGTIPAPTTLPTTVPPTTVPTPTTTTPTTVPTPTTTTPTTVPTPTTTTPTTVPTPTTTTPTTIPSPTTVPTTTPPTTVPVTTPTTTTPVPTSTSLLVAADPSTSDQKFIASVAPIPDGGTVGFSINGQMIGSQPLSDGTATLESAVPVGDQDVTAAFSGDTGFAPSGTSMVLTVTQAPTALQVSPPEEPSGGGEVTLHATLSSEGIPVANGVVWFAADGNELCQGISDQSGQVSCVASNWNGAAGASPTGVSATFEGDPTHLPVVAHVTATQQGGSRTPGHRHRAGIGYVHGGGSTQRPSTPQGSADSSPGPTVPTQPNADTSSGSVRASGVSLAAAHDQAASWPKLAPLAGVIAFGVTAYLVSGWWRRRRRSAGSLP